MADSRFDNVKYICWLKVCMALLFAKEGLEKLTDRWAKTFHEQFKKKLGGHVCESCSTDDLKRQWSQYNMTCNNNICDRWLNAIRTYLTTKQTIEWDNTNISNLPTKPWECLKLFMPYGCEAIKEARDADLAGILTLYINNKHFQALIGGNSPLLEKVKDIRNKIMHSGNLELEKKEMEEYIDTILELLQCHPNLSADNDCNDARDNINKLKISVSEVSKHLKEYEVRSLNARLDAMDLTVNQTRHSYNELKKLVEEQTGVETNLESDVENIKTNYDQLNKDCHKLKSKVSQMNQLLSKFTNTDEIKDVDLKRLVNQAEKLADMERDLQTINGHISNLEQRLHSCEGRLDQHDIKASQHGQRLDQQEMVSGQHGQRLEQQEMVSGQHGQRLKQQEMVSGQHGQRLNQQEMVSDQHGQRLDQQEMVSDQHGQRLNQQEKKTDILFQLKRKLDEIGSEAGNKKSRETPFEERKKDLQKQLCGEYSKHCGSMSIYPLRPNLVRPCGYLYVSQEMLEKDPRGPKKPQPDITDKFEPSHEQTNKKVNRLNEVFYTDNKLCKDIYITGEAGVGKSTFCDYIVNMWLAAHTGTTVNYTEHSSQDLETMKQFPLLFYVQLKGEHLDSDTDLYANLIEKQWDLGTSVKEFLTEEHCVIIADALDECTSGIPKRGVRNNSTVLTTSRPWKLETLRTDIEGSKIDKHIEIVCLDEQSVETLTEKILPVLAEESGTTVKNSDNFIKEMKEKGLESFLRIPVLLIQILCLWHDNVTIGKSKTSIYCNLVHHQIQVYIKKLSAKDQKKLLSNSGTFLPVNCKVSKCQCRAFNEMLLKVGKMALKTLLSGKLEYELVFDHNITEFHGLCEQEIERCLAIGILSQHKLFGKITELEKFISFVHKSNQEFFGSIYLACKIPISNIRKVLANCICNLDKMLKLEKIIMFVSGLNREMGREMANLLLEAAGRDPRIQEYRQTFNYRHDELVSNVHNVIMATVEESRHNPHEQQQKFRLDDIYVDDDNVSRVLSCFPVMEISRPASIKMEGKYNNHVHVDAVMSHVQNTTGLQRVHLHNCTIDSREIAVKLVPQSLCALHLSFVNLPHEALTTLSHRLKTTKLRELLLDSLICGSHGKLEDGKCGVTFDLTRQSHLEKLYILYCDMSGWRLPTATPKRVDLFSVTIPGAMLARFLRGLPQTGVRVELWDVTVRPAGDIVSCLDQIRGSREVEQDSVEGRGEGGLFVNKFEFI